MSDSAQDLYERIIQKYPEKKSLYNKIDFLAKHLDPFQSMDSKVNDPQTQAEIQFILKDLDLGRIKDPHKLTRIILLILDHLQHPTEH
jgi:hypothetical protein